jgi:hypothetical protein
MISSGMNLILTMRAAPTCGAVTQPRFDDLTTKPSPSVTASRTLSQIPISGTTRHGVLAPSAVRMRAGAILTESYTGQRGSARSAAEADARYASVSQWAVRIQLIGALH